MNKYVNGRTLGIIFFGTNKETGNEEVLEVCMLAPWERNMDETKGREILFDRMTGYWNANEKFFARRGYEDFGMKCLEVA